VGVGVVRGGRANDQRGKKAEGNRWPRGSPSMTSFLEISSGVQGGAGIFTMIYRGKERVEPHNFRGWVQRAVGPSRESWGHDFLRKLPLW